MDYSPISYRMLNEYEFSILSERPLERRKVSRLWKTTLYRFLFGNGVQCDPRDGKQVFIDMILNVIKQDEQQMLNHPVDTPWQEPQFLPDISTPVEMVDDESAAPFVSEECQCHECQHTEAPIPLESEPDYSSDNPTIQPCHVQINLDDWGDIDDNEEFEDSYDCSCNVPVEDLLQNVTLTSDAHQVLSSMANKSVKEIAQFLMNFGVEVDGSGCRIHLLMLLRDFLDEQASAMNTTSGQGAAVPLQNTRNEAAAVTSGTSNIDQQLSDVTTELAHMSTEELSVTVEKKLSTGTTEELAEEDPMKECCICLQNPREIAFVPCGHALCCRNCARRMRECPVCRKRVNRRLKIYFS